MSLRTIKIGSIVVVGLAVAVCAFLVVNHNEESSALRRAEDAIKVAQAAEVREQTADWDRGAISPSQIAQAVIEATATAGTEAIAPDDREAIAREYAAILSLYRGGTLADFDQWRQSTGMPPASWQRGRDPEAYWELTRMPTLGAAIDLDDVRVILRGTGGRALTLPKPSLPGTMSNMNWRRVADEDRGDTGHISMSAYEGDVIEVVIPIVLSDLEGTQLTARMGIAFAKRPSDGRWLPVAAIRYDLPMSAPIIDSPL